MAKLRLASTALSGNVGIAVSQNGRTENVTQASWGVPASTGNITIIPSRTDLRVAPDSVGFEVDLSGAGFDTPAPATAADYDAQYHDLYYFWTFGDPGTYAAPVNVLNEWKDKNAGYGPFVRHMFETEGTYVVGVTVIEPSSGKTASTTLNVLVGNPDAMYLGPRTIVVSDDPQENTWAGAPAGSQKFTNLTSAINAYQALSAPGRLLFKRGGDFSAVNIATSTAWNQPLHFGAWGSGAKPILRQDPNAGTYTNIFAAISITFNRRLDIRVADLDMRGLWDSVSATGNNTYAIRTLISCNLMISGCRATGFHGLVITEAGGPYSRMKHIHDTVVTDFMSYPVFSNPLPGSEVALTGVQIAAHVDAASSTLNDQGGSPVRVNKADKVYIDGCDIFSRQAHGSEIDGPAQPCIKLNDQGDQHGYKINMSRTSCEGGLYVVFIGGVAAGRAAPNLSVLIDKCVFVGDQSNVNLLYCKVGGATFRNNLCIQPPGPRFENAHFECVSYGAQPGDVSLVSPHKTYNNTFVALRSNAENNGHNTKAVNDTVLAPGSVHENNVLYVPNQSTQHIGDLPLDTSTLLWAPRNKGVKPGDTKVMDQSYATHAGSLTTYIPNAGSPALGSALNGMTAVDDIFGRQRPVYPSRGASEIPS